MSDFKERIGDLKLSELELLLELSHAVSLRELARRRSLSPSVISKIIRKVEKSLGLSLVTRSASGMRFTIEGQHFLKTARKILDMSSTLRSGPIAPKSVSRKTFGMAAQSFIHQCLIPDCLASLESQGHSLRFRLLEVPMKDLVVSGINGGFEFAIHLGQKDWPKTWVSKKVGPFRSKLFARIDHPLGLRASSEEVKGYPFVVPVGWSKNGVHNGDDRCPLSWEEREQGDGVATAATALEIISRSDQLAFLPEIVARRFVKEGKIRAITVPEWGEVKETLMLSVRADAVPQKVMNSLITEMTKLLSR